MKRTVPLRSRTPLVRSPLQRSRAKRRPRRRTGPSSAVVNVVRERDGWRCVRCGKASDLSTQHRRARGMGGTRDERVNGYAALITLCGDGTRGCHGWVEASPDKARDLGYRLDNVAGATTTPVWTWRGRWVLLTDEGTYREASA